MVLNRKKRVLALPELP